MVHIHTCGQESYTHKRILTRNHRQEETKEKLATYTVVPEPIVTRVTVPLRLQQLPSHPRQPWTSRSPVTPSTPLVHNALTRCASSGFGCSLPFILEPPPTSLTEAFPSPIPHHLPLRHSSEILGSLSLPICAYFNKTRSLSSPPPHWGRDFYYH